MNGDDLDLLGIAEWTLYARASEMRRSLEYPPMLTPVQLWLLGHIDRPALLDRVIVLEESELKTQAEAIGMAQADESYAAQLIEKAQQAVEAWMDGEPGRPQDMTYRDFLARREDAWVVVRHAILLTQFKADLVPSRELDLALRAGEEVLRSQDREELADEVKDLRERLGASGQPETEMESAYQMYEALTDPVDAAVRLDEARATGVEPLSTAERVVGFDDVCRELGLSPSSGDEARPEAER